MRHTEPNAADFIALLVAFVIFMGAFSWAAIHAEAEANARDKARAECVTDAECEAAYGFDMNGNR